MSTEEFSDPDPGQFAEDVLIEHGVVKYPSPERRATIQCIGCRWLKAEKAGVEPRFYSREVLKCNRQMLSGTLSTLLKKLVEGDVIAPIPEESGQRPGERGARRIYFYPSASEVGQAFYEELVLPDCPLDAAREDNPN